MRKLLLATVAGLGLWGAVGNDAQAQAPITPTVVGGAALPTATTPTPGTVVVRLNGRVRFYAYATSDGDANTPGNKQDKYGFGEYARLYPGFDGIAANGLKYGANLEIRQDDAYPAGGGANGSISTADNRRAALYFRRVWGYLGTDQLGTIRLGSIDQPTSLYLTGNFENFNDGGWDGDVNGFIAGNLQPPWPFPDNSGSYYTTNKIVYLSPQLFGFDFGVSYEPSTANVSGSDNCNAPGTSFSPTFTASLTSYCDRASTTTSDAESARRRNTFDALLRYRGSFGPVGVALTGAFIGGGHVNYDGGAPYTNNPLAPTGQNLNYQGLQIGDFGAAITIGGLSFGGHYETGKFNETTQTTLPTGFPNTNAYVIGTSYTFGPAIVGAHYFVTESAGDLSNAYFGRQRKDIGLAVGGTYSLAPGVSIFLSGLWGERKQNGYNFVTGAGVTAATGSAGSLASNKVTSSLIGIGTAFSW